MTDPIRLIPLPEIDDTALTRDRTGLDDAALTELRLSIAANGLRQPIEVFPLPDPVIPPSGPALRYGLISGLRRLHAFHGLLELTGDPACPSDT